MEWTVVTVIIALVGFVIAVGTPLVKNTKAMTELAVTMNILNDHLEKIENENKDDHKDLQEQLDEHDDMINNHETRIAVIEHLDRK